MSAGPSKDRRYSEEEFALILRKASEIQVSEGSLETGRGTEGYSLGEIQSIAAEAGIDPEAVTRAVSLVSGLQGEGKPGLGALIFGGSGRYHLTVEVPGSLPTEELGPILEEVRRLAEHQGQTSEVLGGLQWKTVGQLNAIHVNVSPRGERTSVQVMGDRSAAGGITFTFPLVGAAILTAAIGNELDPSSVAGIAALVTGMFGGGFLLARTLWVRGSRRFRRRLDHLMEALSGSVRAVSELPDSPEPEEEESR